MISILPATQQETLEKEWHMLDLLHYGKPIQWEEKPFRFKAEENDELVGTVDGKFESGVLYIGSLITKESARHKGIGTKLIAAAEEFGKNLGAHRTWLVTGKTWQENEFYKKLGFTKIAELPDFFHHTDFVIYTRKIA